MPGYPAKIHQHQPILFILTGGTTLDIMVLSSAESAIHQRLKQATQQSHDNLESCLPLLDSGLSWARYRSIMEQFYGFYGPLEARNLRTSPSWLHEELLNRRKVPWLIEDLTHLGLARLEIGCLPLCEDIPPIRTEAELLGSLYVVEGATLGGHVVSRCLSQSLGEGSVGCSQFFQSYGADVPQKWRSFLELLSQRINSAEQEEQAVRMACATFVAFERWLTDGKGPTQSPQRSSTDPSSWDKGQGIVV